MKMVKEAKKKGDAVNLDDIDWYDDPVLRM
jgi:hypothetical protein